MKTSPIRKLVATIFVILLIASSAHYISVEDFDLPLVKFDNIHNERP